MHDEVGGGCDERCARLGAADLAGPVTPLRRKEAMVMTVLRTGISGTAKSEAGLARYTKPAGRVFLRGVNQLSVVGAAAVLYQEHVASARALKKEGNEAQCHASRLNYERSPGLWPE